MTEFTVKPDTLHEYSRELAGNKSAVSQVIGMVDQADVGDESWGLVGLAVKQKYTAMLTDLKDLLSEMENGLQSASDKMTGAAQAYQEAEAECQRVLQQITEALDQCASPGIRV